jgi:spore coat protein A, manganese oxidase
LGFYIIEDELERSLPLPKGDYDIPLILQTKRFTTTGKIVFNNGTPKNLLGDISSVNGVPSPQLEVANRKYRFRLLNASGTRHYLLALSRSADRLTDNESLIIISSDAGFLSKPVQLVSPQQALHEDRGMMSQFELGNGGLDPITAAPAQPISKIRPF